MIDLEREIRTVLQRYLGDITAGVVLKYIASRSQSGIRVVTFSDRERLAASLRVAAQLFVLGASETSACLKEIDGLLDGAVRQPRSSGKIRIGRLLQMDTEGENGTEPSGVTSDTVVKIESEDDVVVARGFAREVARRLGFSPSDQVKIATATSELARNIVLYANCGQVSIRPVTVPVPAIEIVAEDTGKGITNLESILAGNYRSTRGMGRGLCGTRAIMDEFEVKTAPNRGTRVRIRKLRKAG